MNPSEEKIIVEKQDIQSVLALLAGIEDEKARKIENFIKKYLLQSP